MRTSPAFEVFYVLAATFPFTLLVQSLFIKEQVTQWVSLDGSSTDWIMQLEATSNETFENQWRIRVDSLRDAYDSFSVPTRAECWSKCELDAVKGCAAINFWYHPRGRIEFNCYLYKEGFVAVLDDNSGHWTTYIQDNRTYWLTFNGYRLFNHYELSTDWRDGKCYERCAKKHESNNCVAVTQQTSNDCFLFKNDFGVTKEESWASKLRMNRRWIKRDGDYSYDPHTGSTRTIDDVQCLMQCIKEGDWCDAAIFTHDSSFEFNCIHVGHNATFGSL